MAIEKFTIPTGAETTDSSTSDVKYSPLKLVASTPISLFEFRQRFNEVQSLSREIDRKHGRAERIAVKTFIAVMAVGLGVLTARRG